MMDGRDPNNGGGYDSESDDENGSIQLDSDDSSAAMDEGEVQRRLTECLEDIADMERQSTLLRQMWHHERNGTQRTSSRTTYPSGTVRRKSQKKVQGLITRRICSKKNNGKFVRKAVSLKTPKQQESLKI